MLLKAGADAPDFVSQLLRPSTLCGLALYGSAAFLYIIALRKIPVSVAFPSVSLSYAIVAVLGHFLFGEPFGIKQIGGIALIMGGVVADQPDLRESVVDYEQIKYETKDGILTITLNRPDKLNAFTGKMLSELLDAMDRADRDDDVRAVVFTGAGRGFCAGADLSGGANTFNAENRGRSIPASTAIATAAACSRLRLYDSLKPTIAACNGPAVGVGITMQLAMDMRLASEAARYGFVFTRRAIVMEACSSWFLPRLVGPQQALEWVMTGRVFPAEEALKGRLVRSVHKPDELLPAAYALAREIADNTAPVSVALNRQMIWKMLGADHPMEAHKVDSKGIYARGKSADVKEGVTAFLEKRPARFPMKVSDGHAVLFPVVDRSGRSSSLGLTEREWTYAALPAANNVPEETMTKLHLRRRTILARRARLLGRRALRGARAEGKPEKTKVVLAVGGKSALYYLSLTIAETEGLLQGRRPRRRDQRLPGRLQVARGPDGRQRRRRGRRLRAHHPHAAARPADQGLRPDRPRHADRHRPAQATSPPRSRDRPTSRA